MMHPDFISIQEEIRQIPASLEREDEVYFSLQIFILRLLFGADHWFDNMEKLNRRYDARHAND